MKITVLQWNVWYQEKADNILQALREFDADILCLQELSTDSYINPGRNLPAEIKKLGYHAYYETALYLKSQEPIRFGNGIFSKTPLNATIKFYTQQASPDRQEKEDRLYIQPKTAIDGNELIIGTVQLSWTPAP